MRNGDQEKANASSVPHSAFPVPHYFAMPPAGSNSRYSEARDRPNSAAIPSALKSGDEVNKLLVVCRGGRKLVIYVNDSAIGPPVLLDQPLVSPVHQYLVLWKRGRATKDAGRAEFKRFTLWELPAS